jgi:LAO/AO transport system kinase
LRAPEFAQILLIGIQKISGIGEDWLARQLPNGIELADALKKGSVRALARLISLVESNHPEAEQSLQYLYPQTGRAYVIGITGPAGSGKSSLVDQITLELRKQNISVGILATDPTSPFSGGAILGDRFRMQNVVDDPEVYIRSLGTRGNLGGLSKATSDAIHLLDAFGKDVIILETVGAGQDEVDVVKMADTCIVVMVPGLGDDIQAIKAGIMEIADIFAVNKADRDDVDRVVQDIHNMLNLKTAQKGWDPRIVKTVATKPAGIDQLLADVWSHREYMETSGKLEKHRRNRLKTEVMHHLAEEIYRHIDRRIKTEYDFDKYLNEVFEKKKDPYSLVQELMWPITKHL